MKRVIAVASVFVLGMTSFSMGALPLKFTPSTPSIRPGESFTLSVSLSGGTAIKSVSFWADTNDTTGSFSIASMALGGSLTDPQQQQSLPVTLPNITVDLGSTAPSSSPGFSGIIDLGTLTITSLASTPQGLYTFTPLYPYVGDANGADFSSQVECMPATIEVIPEPVSLLLLAFGGLGLLRRKI